MTIQDDLPHFLEKYHGKIRLAPLKMNIHLLMQALADEDLDAKQLAAVLQHYAVISARLIGLANSSWASPLTPITTLETACIRLGNSLVKSMSLAIAVASSFNIQRCPSFDPVRFWTTGMLVAEGAALLANKLSRPAAYPKDIQYTVQTVGILHNLGLLWLADNLPKEMETALLIIASNPVLFVNQVLNERIGVDYCKIGGWIAGRWELPDEFIVIIENHRNEYYQGYCMAQVVLVGAAAKMVSALCHGDVEIGDYAGLQTLGIDYASQAAVFQQLAAKFDQTQELAKYLISG